LSWDNHRWVRYRSLMGLVEKMLTEIDFAIRNPIDPDGSYFDLIDRGPNDAPHSYKWKGKQQAFAHRATEELMQLAERWQKLQEQEAAATFDNDDVPKPRPELRVRPRV
jgi:hypothetical protein